MSNAGYPDDHSQAPDPSGLERFAAAQEATYTRAVAELRQGEKQSHWMWYIFPQMRGLGRSPLAQRYGIASAAEARAYLAHPVLGPRLLECTQLALDANKASASDIFPFPDDLKFRSCMTLFAQVAAKPSVFTAALQKYCGGEPDPETLRLLAGG
jgi:uncharacterized protein (DUF1810 family)